MVGGGGGVGWGLLRETTAGRKTESRFTELLSEKQNMAAIASIYLFRRLFEMLRRNGS